jgi:cytochrome c oxidase subunit 2
MPAFRRARCVAAIVVAAVLAGCGDLGEPKGATEQSGWMGDLWRGSVIAALIVGAFVVSLIIWCVLRYRHRAADPLPTQRQYHVPLEVVYTSLPILIVLTLFVISYSVQNRVDALSSRPIETIEVTGFQWQWQFHYPANGITITGAPNRTPELVVPTGGPVRFVLTSRDVIHSFYVPHFLFKRDVIPGVKNRFDITVQTPGRYKGYCAEFCGLDHARMTFSVRALRRAEYRRWVAQQQEAAP